MGIWEAISINVTCWQTHTHYMYTHTHTHTTCTHTYTHSNTHTHTHTHMIHTHDTDTQDTHNDAHTHTHDTHSKLNESMQLQLSNVPVITHSFPSVHHILSLSKCFQFSICLQYSTWPGAQITSFHWFLHRAQFSKRKDFSPPQLNLSCGPSMRGNCIESCNLSVYS